MIRLVLVAALVGACSAGTGAPASSGAATRPREPATPPTAVGVLFDRTGELGDCDPTGVWRAVGTSRGVGDCPAADSSAEPIAIEVEVVRASDGFRLVAPAGVRARADSVDLSGGACALSFELQYRLAERDRPQVVVFADLVAGAPSAAIWDEYQPGADGPGFDPAQGVIRCSDALELEVSRDARRGE
ncbi:MAG TPA: hypothetical protein VML75_22800 [Kofleriaceae bacterium]|nr:hypothetical protein [Kofleriaceae bacterium]